MICFILFYFFYLLKSSAMFQRNLFSRYMTKHSELEGAVREKYQKQIDVMWRICQLYERQEPFNPENLNEQTEEICGLIMELQTYGYPPEEVVGSMPGGWSLDQSSGLPLVDDVSKAASACNFM